MEKRVRLSPAAMRGMFGRMAIIALASVLAACSGEAVKVFPTQHWNGINVHVESRPGPPQDDMSEILVMTTDSRGRPVYDLVVSLRDSDKAEWSQAIEDGQVGVYRKAIRMAEGKLARIQVRLERDNAVKVLYFPDKP